MKIELDLRLLEETGLTIEEYSALYLVFRKGYNYLESMALSPNWEVLQEKGYVKLGTTVGDHVIRQEFVDLFSSDFENMFVQLLTKYPMKVNTDNGVRILRASSPDAKANLKSRNRYKKLVGNKPHVHRHILACLDKQLLLERDNLAYMQNLETWINNHTWEKYEDIDLNDARKTEGQQRNMRVL